MFFFCVCCRKLRQVKLDKKLFLIDSPGVVFPSADMDFVEAALKNVVNVKLISDPQQVAQAIFDRCDRIKVSKLF